MESYIYLVIALFLQLGTLILVIIYGIKSHIEFKRKQREFEIEMNEFIEKMKKDYGIDLPKFNSKIKGILD